MNRVILPLHAAFTWMMVGVIWFVQLVHYPLLNKVGPDQFAAYASSNRRLTAWVLAPIMLVEAVTALRLVARRPERIPPAATWAGLGFLAVIWISTALIQLPLHAVLALGPDSGAYETLLASNWIRTVVWTARGGLVCWMLARVSKASRRKPSIDGTA